MDIAENADGDCVKANDAEERVIEEVRKLGQETLQDWANGQNSQQMQQVLEKTTQGVIKSGNSSSPPPFF